MAFEAFLLTAILSGVVIGSLYAVMSIGLTIIWGISRVLNFAHGATSMITAYIFWIVLNLLGLDLVSSTVLAIVFAFIFGLAINRGLISPLRKKPNFEITTILATLALAMLLEQVINIYYGARYKTLPSLAEGTVNILGYTTTIHNVVLAIISIIILIILGIFLKKAKLGMAMRAVSQELVGSNIVGINISSVYLYTFALGAIMAGLAGIFLGSVYYVRPPMGWEFLLLAFLVVAFGGLGNIRGTLYAAYTIGIIQAVISTFYKTEWSMPILFLLMILMLGTKPSGIFGRR